ncbi:MAG: hypothetical protein ACKVQR_03125 [Aquabacterium sp.]
MTSHHPLDARRAARLAGLCLAAALLAACGGGADTPPPPTADPLAAVPDNARNTVSGLVDYLGTLNRNQADGREAIDLGTMTSLPTNEDAEPAAI